MSFGFGGLGNFDGDLFDAEYVLGEAGDFVGMEHQRVVFVVTNFWVEAFGVEVGIEDALVGVGVAVDGGSRAVENFLDGFDG